MKAKSTFNDSHTPRLLAKIPIIGLIMLVIGILIFSILAYNLVNNGPLIKWDLSIAESFHNLALESPPWILTIMVAGFYIGYHLIVIMAVLLALYFLYKRFWCEFTMVAASIGLSGLIFVFLARTFKRARPSSLYDQPIWANSPSIPGFPSGHTISIVVFYGLLIYLLLPRIKSYFGKVLAITIALLIIFYVGFSRIYLGDHYLTDIIAGYAIGLAWLGLTCTSVELLFQKYRLKKRKN